MAAQKKSITQLNVSAVFGKGFNLSWLFFVIFLILICLEILEIKNSVSLILTVNKPAPLPVVSSDPSSRVDFSSYDQIIGRIQAAQNFQPTNAPTSNPFADPTSTPLSGQ